MRKIFIWSFLIILLASSSGFWAAYCETKGEFKYTLPQECIQPDYETHRNSNISCGYSFLGKRQIKEKTRNIYDIKYVFGKPKKVLIEKTVTTYDRKGNKISGVRVSITSAERADVFSAVVNAVVKDLGIGISEELRDILPKAGDTDIGAYKYKYDEDNHEISKVNYNDEGKLVSRETYKYDERGNVIKESSYDEKGNLEREYEYFYKYDERGNKIEERYYKTYDKGARWHENWRTKYKYDEKSNLIEEARYLPSGETDQQFSYKYDDKGNKIMEDFSRKESAGIDGSITVYPYDNRGNLVGKLVTKRKEGEMVDCWGESYTYEYNWRGVIKTVKTYELTPKLLEAIAVMATKAPTAELKNKLLSEIKEEENLIITYGYKYYPRWFLFF